MAERTSNQIANGCHRQLALKFDGSGGFGGTAKAIGTTAPTTQGLEIAMGVVGDDNIASVEIDTAVTLTVWKWSRVSHKWIKLGANSTQNTKAFDANSEDGFNALKGTAIFFTASAVVANAYTDMQPHTLNPTASTLVA